MSLRQLIKLPANIYAYNLHVLYLPVSYDWNMVISLSEILAIVSGNGFWLLYEGCMRTIVCCILFNNIS